jgi:hypothetical protein
MLYWWLGGWLAVMLTHRVFVEGVVFVNGVPLDLGVYVVVDKVPCAVPFLCCF